MTALAWVAAYLLVGFLSSVAVVRLMWKRDFRRGVTGSEFWDDGLYGIIAILIVAWPVVLLVAIPCLIFTSDTLKNLYTPAEVRKANKCSKR